MRLGVSAASDGCWLGALNTPQSSGAVERDAGDRQEMEKSPLMQLGEGREGEGEESPMGCCCPAFLSGE